MAEAAGGGVLAGGGALVMDVADDPKCGSSS